MVFTPAGCIPEPQHPVRPDFQRGGLDGGKLAIFSEFSSEDIATLFSAQEGGSCP
jgi:hypothetical protein